MPNRQYEVKTKTRRTEETLYSVELDAVAIRALVGAPVDAEVWVGAPGGSDRSCVQLDMEDYSVQIWWREIIEG